MRKKKNKQKKPARPDYTTSGLIREPNRLAEIGIVNAKEDTETLRVAADRLFSMREELDPLWNRWLILDEGLFLERIDENGESIWTDNKDDTVWFEEREEAEKYINDHIMQLGGGCAVLRGDLKAGGMNIFFCGNS